MTQIESLAAFSPQALNELVLWLQPWFLNNGNGSSAASLGCRVYNTTDQIIAGDATPYAVTFDTERYDTDSMHSTSSNTSRITFNTAGVYIVIGQLNLGASAAGTARDLNILLNGSTVIARFREVPNASANVNDHVCTIWNFSAADYVELTIAQDTGGNLIAGANGDFSNEFMAQKIG